MAGAPRRLRTALGDLELYSEPAPGEGSNEDVIDADGAAAWLLDGASAHDDPQACKEHNAPWFTSRLSGAIRDGLALDPHRDLSSVLADAITTVTQQHERLCPHVPPGHGPSATAVIVRRRDDQLDYLVLGDSTLLVETNDGTVHHHSDKRLAEVAPELRHEILVALRAGHGYDRQHCARVANLRAYERGARNTPAGFWIASENPEAAFHALAGTYSVDQHPGAAGRLALISDGLERAVTHLKLYDDQQQLMTALIEHGAAACIDAIRDAETRDPTGHQLPRTKRADDASALILDLRPRGRVD
jgi:protein phosphatase 2C-like protein